MSSKTARRALALAAAAALLGSAPAALARPAATSATGLPAVSSGHRPGPDILYAPAPRAPQLESTGVWKADPILVSGAQAYRKGEWLYQDYLYDDHGATGVPDPNGAYGPKGFLFAPAGGSYTYPTSAAYANNAADLVELRIKPLTSATAFRITLNTLKDPNRTASTIALGTSDVAVSWPHGAGVKSLASFFLTVHGGTAELVNAATGAVVMGSVPASVDLTRRQITVTVPHAAWNPGHGVVRTTIGVGLWDPNANRYLSPVVGPATASAPGGGPGPAIVNVGPRLDEPQPQVRGGGYTLADTAVLGNVQAAMWRERFQSQQLAVGDVTPFAAEVDFGKLAANVTDESGVPTTGSIDRIFASHYSFGQGLDPARVCYDLPTQFKLGAKCEGRFIGQLQPYALYVPAKPTPRSGFGMTLLLHSLSANYNQYAGSHNQSQLGDRGSGSLTLTPAGRGPDGFYAGVPEADTFEAWADVARHYRLDQTLTDVSGYSMGGFGTYRLAARWPDLFARAFSVVGEPGTVNDQLASLRNLPLLAWNAAADELVNINTSETAVKEDTAAGIRFQEDLFLNADHLTLAANDEYGPGAAFLGANRVDRDPFHVTFVLDPTEDSAKAQTVSDHAYWVSGMQANGAGVATIDVTSAAFGQSDGAVLPIADGAGALLGGAYPLAFASRAQEWMPGKPTAKRDELMITATNLRAVTIDVARARVSCAVKVTAESDNPLRVTLAGCNRTVAVAKQHLAI